ncbi:putative aldouronate transport system permease protein [Paenibacillus endophyticus]|uniref:Putative aldouronate transport system permease protein n=1 Tax=Paenibacillus endophyticus TaxID=1294268 RepID=A0A7W5CCW4_9BACL|nr:carbohydrate ABC transporter permease [Paenibacillus endophyticus]MBB3155287.1 putative aldouronate transport system permease protein [Paenibacillus endophyticus]
MSSQTSRRENKISPLTNIVLNIGFILLSLACVLPVILVIIVSVTHNDSLLNRGYSFLPEKLSWIAYESLFKDYSTIFGAYGVSIGVTVVGTILSVIFMALYAYPISRADYPFRGIFTFFLFFTMLFNGGIVSKYIVFTQTIGLLDSYAALILPLLIIPFNVIIMRTFFQTTIHPALIESARIDGGGELLIFIRIVLPLSLPVMATMALLSTIVYWNDWFNALLFIRTEEKYPLQYLMMRVLNDVQFMRSNVQLAAQNPQLMKDLPNESLQMAMAVVGMGPILLVYPFFQKYFVKGLTVGAVKG